MGGLLWVVYLASPLEGKGKAKQSVTDWSFLRSRRFWMLTALIFCQNAAEQSVTGLMVTYFKGSGIITGAMAAYTVTVMSGRYPGGAAADRVLYSPLSVPARQWWSWAWAAPCFILH